jgi:hypothetical protein
VVYETWYEVSYDLDMYDTGTGWSYAVRHRNIIPFDYVVTEYRKSGGVATRHDIVNSRDNGKATAMMWAAARMMS